MLKIAVGPGGDGPRWTEWTETIMKAWQNRQWSWDMDGLSLHSYTVVKWPPAFASVGFGEAEYSQILKSTLEMENLIATHSGIMDKYDPQKRVGLMVDEWGTWYDIEPGRDMGALYQQNTLRDAIAAGINLNIFHKHADRVKMTNIAQMINVLQAMILTDKGKMVLTPTYHVFRMYRVHQGATLIPVDLSAPEYKLGDASVPSLSVSASRDSEGRLHVSIINLNPNQPAELTTTIWGGAIKSVIGEVLTAPAVNSMNTFESPNTVKPAPFSRYKLEGSQVSLSIPAKSVVALEFK
jgi:alpha-N-arabinofuranosidase